ncbi:hypothetical protein E2C06_13395 [Dankookia rubra]|uniref:Uncharacterized protein n=1 Tax=Dankookia rubra TaxID=1442381 RepID=A0A4R5QFW2_9PROT|nr:hypothetical protein [Dankookia rubra]TDH62162.1 hypothetical protein E2C06_13395 [Dankookia rubra]
MPSEGGEPAADQRQVAAVFPHDPVRHAGDLGDDVQLAGQVERAEPSRPWPPLEQRRHGLPRAGRDAVEHRRMLGRDVGLREDALGPRRGRGAKRIQTPRDQVRAREIQLRAVVLDDVDGVAITLDHHAAAVGGLW